MPQAPANWTTRTLLAWMSGAFGEQGLDSPRRLAEELLAHVLGCERLALYTDADRPASPLERAQLRDLVKRALAHEPVQYLVGHESFYGLKLHVDRRVLIPRPSTLTLVDAVLAHAKRDPRSGPVRDSEAGSGLLIADVCTGSGCVAIALAKNLPGARFVATDLSADALEVARDNAERLGVSDRIDFEHGDLLDALEAHASARNAGSLGAIAANPPYVPDHEWDAVEPNVKDHEPHGALRAGADGLEFVRPLIEQGPERLAAGGMLAVEIAACTAAEVLKLAEDHKLLERCEVRKDHEGLARVLVARRR